MKPALLCVLALPATSCASQAPASAPALAPAAAIAAPALSTPPAAATVTEPLAAVPAPCLPAAAKEAGVSHAEVVGAALLVCYGDGSATEHPCLAVDTETLAVVAARTWKPEAEAEPPAPAPAVTMTLTLDAIQVCERGKPTCSTVRPGYRALKMGDDEHFIASLSPDGKRVVVLAVEPVAGRPRNQVASSRVFADSFDVKTGRRLSRVRVDNDGASARRIFVDHTDIWRLSWVGEWVMASDHVCCGPAGSTILFDPKKGTSRFLHGYQGAFVRAAGSQFVAVDRKTVSLVDVDTGEASAPLTLPGEPVGDPELTSAEVVIAGGRAYVAHANPPGVLRVDLRARKSDGSAMLPLCR